MCVCWFFFFYLKCFLDSAALKHPSVLNEESFIFLTFKTSFMALLELLLFPRVKYVEVTKISSPPFAVGGLVLWVILILA